MKMITTPLHQAAQRTPQKEGSGRTLAGWGVFNFVEGLVDHQILGIHHVLPGHPMQFWFDMLFLLSGLVLIAVGLRIGRPEGVASKNDAALVR